MVVLSVQPNTFLMFEFVSAVVILSAKFVATSTILGIDNFCFAKRDLLAMMFCCVPFGWNTTA